MSGSQVVAALMLVLGLAPARVDAQTMSNPVGCDGCIGGWFYFDNNGDAAGDEDWSCASSSYDGHRGSDFSMNGGNGAIGGGQTVVAAADGVVVSTLDGNFDACTSCPAAGASTTCGLGFGSGFGNHVVITHGSYRAVYAHMRNGSVRVSPGDTVRCGDTVGEIASSGCSSGAHLHFETRPLSGTFRDAFDPFAGACSPTSPSLWATQGPHRGMPGRACGDPTPTCPEGTFPIWTCDAGGTERRRCIDGVDMREPCDGGCLSMPVGTDDTCAPPPDGDGDGAAADVDCDDDDSGRFPGNPETCGDAVDQDCDGADLACPEGDAGQARADTGAGGLDAAMPPGRDAAVSSGDASQSVRDGGANRPDGGRAESLMGACSCRVGPGRGGSAPRWCVGLLVLLGRLGRRLGRQRRRRTRAHSKR